VICSDLENPSKKERTRGKKITQKEKKRSEDDGAEL
jgi:hypothetical protein